ncbi:hypothetical protein DL766_002245 [Monosporascus sp. MC13-8B]|uniref:EthD domain-containing protein n=1 Tax=Monosporascus cannonballus TaxID=155416 RepID=A0ABY0HKJ0_9PEZI|nr:hypothetical protein DL763_004131 [Monosporascus cannonballus]RYO94600.1 hypothetical protein DL762_000492 [Monosporascus cannonballus]RYP35975.1 hypothetical protein DL766_002245 [Monosporascus sp. MC13-8B]
MAEYSASSSSSTDMRALARDALSMAALGPISVIPPHSRLIWLKFYQEGTSRDGQGRYFKPWSRSVTTYGDLVAREQTLLGEMQRVGCQLRQHSFLTTPPPVHIDTTHDIVVLHNYNEMCIETHHRQPKSPEAEDLGQVRNFSRFLVSADQMIAAAAANPNIDKSNYRQFWGVLGEPLGEHRAQQATVFVLLDDWNPDWVKGLEKAEWASDILVLNDDPFDMADAFRHKAQQVSPLASLVSPGSVDFRYCHWKTLHN